VADEHAVLVVAQIIVQVATAQKKLFANEQTPDFVFGDLCGLWSAGRYALRSRR
jgi:hypothetical protein